MYKRIIKTLCILSCIINACFILCINVHAETASYVSVSAHECFEVYKTVWNSNGQDRWYYLYEMSVDTRVVKIDDRVYIISDIPFNYARNAGSSQACSAALNSSASSTSSGYYQIYLTPSSTNDWEAVINETIPSFSQRQGLSIVETAIYYTYGEGAVDPIEPINWGQLRDVNYSTQIAGTGKACLSNLDTITWNTSYDSFGNELTDECMVDIRAIRGSWSGNTEEEVLNLFGDSMVFEYTVAPVLATVPVGNGTFSIEWDDVISELNIDSYISLLNVFKDATEKYVKEGWIYEIRLVNEMDDYTGTWQKVYTATSGTASGSESIINNTNFNTIIYQSLEQISILNNQQTTIININGTDYPIENPGNGVPPEEDPEDKTQTIIDDLWELIKIIKQGFFNVVDAIQSIPEKIGNLFQELFTMGEVDSSVTEELTSIQEDYVSENQSNALNTLNVLEDIQDELHDAAGEAHDCIFEWDDVALRIPGSASDVILIQGGTYNFTNTFLQMIEGFGMTYQQYQDLVSAVIYCLTALFVYRHVTTFLRGYGD